MAGSCRLGGAELSALVAGWAVCGGDFERSTAARGVSLCGWALADGGDRGGADGSGVVAGRAVLVLAGLAVARRAGVAVCGRKLEAGSGGGVRCDAAGRRAPGRVRGGGGGRRSAAFGEPRVQRFDCGAVGAAVEAGTAGTAAKAGRRQPISWAGAGGAGFDL